MRKKYFYCHKCKHEDWDFKFNPDNTGDRCKITLNNPRDGFGETITHIVCPECGDVLSGYMRYNECDFRNEGLFPYLKSVLEFYQDEEDSMFRVKELKSKIEENQEKRNSRLLHKLLKAKDNLKAYHVIRYVGNPNNVIQFHGIFLEKDNALLFKAESEYARDIFKKHAMKQLEICDKCMEMFKGVESESEFISTKEIAAKNCVQGNSLKVDKYFLSNPICKQRLTIMQDLKTEDYSFKIEEFEILDLIED